MLGLNKYITIGALVVIAALAATIGALMLRIDTLAAELKAANLATAVVTAERNAVLTVIPAEAEARTKIRDALAQCVGVAQEIERTAIEAQAHMRDAIAARNLAQASLRAEREKWNANDPACAAWSRDVLCPAASGSLRRLWSQAGGGGETRDGRGGAQAVRATAGEPHDAAALVAAPDPGGLQEADCYSNAQLYDALESVLSAYGQAGDQFQAIERIQTTAVDATEHEP